MDITIVEKRASDAVNGFTTIRIIHAKDTLETIKWLRQTLEANHRLKNALDKANEEIIKLKATIENPDFSNIFADLMKGKTKY